MNIVFLVSISIYNKIIDILNDYDAFIAKAGKLRNCSQEEIGKFIKRLDRVAKREKRDPKPICFSYHIDGSVYCLGRQVIPIKYIPENYFIMIADKTMVLKKTEGDIEEEMKNEFKRYIKGLDHVTLKQVMFPPET